MAAKGGGERGMPGTFRGGGHFKEKQKMVCVYDYLNAIAISIHYLGEGVL